MKVTAGQIAALVKGDVEGDPNIIINNFSKIEEGQDGCITFLANPKYLHYAYTTKASAILVHKDFVAEKPITATLIKVDDPYATLAELLKMVQSQNAPKEGVESPVYISEGVEVPEGIYLGAFSYLGAGVKIGRNVKIYPQCYVGDNVTIGDNTILYAGVKIYYNCEIGSNCILHSGVVVGGDGFGFAPDNGKYTKIAQIGNVIIEDDVEIGANTAVDRATMGSTIIRRGVKLDNLIQIAHNVEVGEHTVMAAQVGISGSTKIGHHNMIGGQCGLAGHITVGNNNKIGAQSGIHSNIGDEKSLIGYPAVDFKDFAKQSVYVRNLGALNAEVRELKKQMKELKENNK